MKILSQEASGTRFRIITPFYNASKWLKTNITSVKEQTYSNFTVTLVNDVSTDDSVQIAFEAIAGDERFEIRHTEENGGALASTCLGIENLNLKPWNDDVIIILDGDDWLANKEVLFKLDEVYSSDPKIILTYGSYVEYVKGIRWMFSKLWMFSKRGMFSEQLPENIITNKLFRESKWMTSHIRTFKYKLWSYVRRKDILDANGKIYSMAGDMPVMFPMLEMAEDPYRIKYISDIMYVYNKTNPLNEYKIDNQLQRSIEAEVRAKKKYPSLTAMMSGAANEHFND